MSKSSNENYQKWLAVYGRLVEFSLEDWLLMAPYIKIGHITADTMLFEQGEKISSVYFLLDGYGRYFYLDEKGNERNKSLLQKGGAFSCLSCYLEEQPSPFSTQALTDSVIAEIRYADLVTVSEKNLNWGRFVRKIYEQLVLKRETRSGVTPVKCKGKVFTLYHRKSSIKPLGCIAPYRDVPWDHGCITVEN